MLQNPAQLSSVSSWKLWTLAIDMPVLTMTFGKVVSLFLVFSFPKTSQSLHVGCFILNVQPDKLNHFCMWVRYGRGSPVFEHEVLHLRVKKSTSGPLRSHMWLSPTAHSWIESSDSAFLSGVTRAQSNQPKLRLLFLSWHQHGSGVVF